MVLRQKQRLLFPMTLFVINSFSKYFGMTGWRLGWMVVPEDCVPDIDKLAQNLFLAAPTVAQHAALAAFGEKSIAILEARRDEFQERRDFLLPALRELGFDIPVTPDGAFYLYANCSRFSKDSFEFSQPIAGGGRCCHHARCGLRQQPARQACTFCLYHLAGEFA